jgi:hypothetical protein
MGKLYWPRFLRSKHKNLDFLRKLFSSGAPQTPKSQLQISSSANSKLSLADRGPEVAQIALNISAELL